MLLTELNLMQEKVVTIDELKSIVTKSKKPVYIVVCGGVGAGKSFIIDNHFPNVDVVDPDKFTIDLGNGIYDGKNVAKSMSMVKKAVIEKMNNKTNIYSTRNIGEFTINYK